MNKNFSNKANVRMQNTTAAYKTGYTNTKCNAYCYTCGQYGHLRMQCPKELCCICGGNHIKKYCPIKLYDSLEKLHKTLVYGITREPKETPIEVPKKSDRETWWRRVDPSDNEAVKSHDNTYSISHEVDITCCTSSQAATPLQVCHPTNVSFVGKCAQDIINEQVDKLFQLKCKASLNDGKYIFSDLANARIEIPLKYKPLVDSDGFATINATPANEDTVDIYARSTQEKYNKQLEYLGLHETALQINSVPAKINKDLYNYVMNESAYWTRDHTLNDISIPMKYSCVCVYDRNTNNSQVTIQENPSYTVLSREVKRKEPTGVVTFHLNTHNVNNIKYITVPRKDFWLHYPIVESHYSMRRDDLSIRLKNICRTIASVKDIRRLPLGEKLYVAYTLDQVRRCIQAGDSSTLVELTQHCEDLDGNIIVPVAPNLQKFVSTYKLTERLLDDTKQLALKRRDVARNALINTKKMIRNNKKRIVREYKKQKHQAQDITRRAIGTIKSRINALDQLDGINKHIKNKLVKVPIGSRTEFNKARAHNYQAKKRGKEIAKCLIKNYDEPKHNSGASRKYKEYTYDDLVFDERDLN